jgi:oxaloacetate decarboxylase gamma subunit
MTEQLAEASILLSVGMTVVFAFLTFLIAGIHAIAWFCRTFPSTEDELTAVKKQTKRTNNVTSTAVSPHIAAAITAAVHTHRHTTIKQ